MNKTLLKILKSSILYPAVVLNRRYELYLTKNNPVKLIKKRYKNNIGLKLDLKNPKNLDEKINYMSFYSDTSIWSELADKYKVRSYVEKCGYGELLNELYGVYNSVDEIDFSKLPTSFVLKTNHASATNYFVLDKNNLDHKDLRIKFGKWLKLDYGIKTAAPHYSKIAPRIIAEKYLAENDNYHKHLSDYKIYCFNGEPKYIFLFSNRKTNSHDYEKMIYDTNWNPRKEFINKGLVKSEIVSKPKSLNKMIEAARVMSKPFPFVRVDFYEICDTPVFGEFTFTPGHNSAASPKFLEKMGGLVDLNYNR